MKLQISWWNEANQTDEVYEGEIPDILENDELFTELEDILHTYWDQVGTADFFAHEDKMIGWHLDNYFAGPELPQKIYGELEKKINESHT